MRICSLRLIHPFIATILSLLRRSVIGLRGVPKDEANRPGEPHFATFVSVRRSSWRCIPALILLCMGQLADANIPELRHPMGVTHGRGETTFRVWAPNAESVAVIGDFNNWRPRAADRMTQDRTTGIWRVTIRGARPRGAYQFLINGEWRRRDPYGRAVTPDGQHSVFYDPDEFRWRNIPPPRYELEELVIYELHIGSFYHPHPNNRRPATFDDAIRRLDHLVDLGVNTICLLPVNTFNGHFSWGYNPSDLFSIEDAYGGPDGLKRFVEACHERGLAVHIDIVHNHYGPENLDLIQFDGTGNASNGGIYFYDGNGIGITPWGPRPRFEEPMVRRFILDNVLMWLDEYRMDGFRWDSTINIRAYNDGRSPIPEGARMLEDINQVIIDEYPGIWSIAEDSIDIGNFHGSWQYDFHHMVMPALEARNDANRDVRRVAAALARVPRTMWRVVYVDNHDEAGKLNDQVRIASDIDPGNPGSDYARRLSGLGAVITFTAPGIPLLFMGNEFQEYGTWHDDVPLDWSKARRHEGTLNLHRDLIALRRNAEGHSIGLSGLGLRTPVTDNEQKHLVYWRSHDSDPNDQTVIAINFTGQPSDIIIPFPSVGPWKMRLNSDWTEYGGETDSDGNSAFTLAAGARAQTRMAPHSARIFTLVYRPGKRPPIEERPTAAARPVAEQPPSAAPEEPERYFSIWRSAFLTGSFNEWDPAAWPFDLVADEQWEGYFFFEDVENPRFKITVNERDSIFWGRPAERFAVSDTITLQARRMAPEIVIRDTWSGLYRIRFNDTTRELSIERVGDEPLPEEVESAPEVEVEPLRDWTDANGNTVRARLLEACFETPVIVLEREDGSTVRAPVRGLSRDDRLYVRDWIQQRQ